MQPLALTSSESQVWRERIVREFPESSVARWESALKCYYLLLKEPLAPTTLATLFATCSAWNDPLSQRLQKWSQSEPLDKRKLRKILCNPLDGSPFVQPDLIVNTVAICDPRSTLGEVFTLTEVTFEHWMLEDLVASGGGAVEKIVSKPHLLAEGLSLWLGAHPEAWQLSKEVAYLPPCQEMVSLSERVRFTTYLTFIKLAAERQERKMMRRMLKAQDALIEQIRQETEAGLALSRARRAADAASARQQVEEVLTQHLPAVARATDAAMQDEQATLAAELARTRLSVAQGTERRRALEGENAGLQTRAQHLQARVG